MAEIPNTEKLIRERHNFQGRKQSKFKSEYYFNRMIYLLEELPRHVVDSPFNFFTSKSDGVLQNPQTISLKL